MDEQILENTSALPRRSYPWWIKLFAGLLRLANVLRFLWFDALYAAGVAMLLPLLFGFI